MDYLILSQSLFPPLDLGCGSEKLKNSWQLFLESLYESGLQPTAIPSQPQSIWQLTSPKSMGSISNFILRVFSFAHCYSLLQYIHEQMCLKVHSVGTQFIIYSDECVISNHAATSATNIKTIAEIHQD